MVRKKESRFGELGMEKSAVVAPGPLKIVVTRLSRYSRGRPSFSYMLRIEGKLSVVAIASNRLGIFSTLSPRLYSACTIDFPKMYCSYVGLKWQFLKLIVKKPSYYRLVDPLNGQEPYDHHEQDPIPTPLVSA